MKRLYFALLAGGLGLSAIAAPFQLNKNTQLIQPCKVQKEAKSYERVPRAQVLEMTKKSGPHTRADETSIEGTWTFTLGDYYLVNSLNKEITVDYEATLDGTKITFEDPTGNEFPFVGEYDATNNTIVFTRLYLGQAGEYQVYQQPFEFSYSERDVLDIAQLVGKYYPSPGIITFSSDQGLEWPAYSDINGTNLLGYFRIYDFVNASKVLPAPDDEEIDEVQAGQWNKIGTATFVDAWILPSYTMGGQQINPNDYAYEVELQQNINDPNLYRLWKPYKTTGCLLYEQNLNQSKYEGQIQFNITDKNYIQVVACGLPTGFKNNNGEFYVSNELGWFMFNYPAYSKEEIISTIYEGAPGDTYDATTQTVTINNPMFDFSAAYADGYSWNNNPYQALITSLDFPMEESEDPDTPTVDNIYYSLDHENMTATVTGCDATLSVLNIPATINVPSGVYSVTSVGETAFYNNKTITTVTIPASITTVANDAFRNLTNLRTLNIADLKAWCAIEFANGNANPLYNVFPTSSSQWGKVFIEGEQVSTTLDIPEGVTSIGRAFYGFKSLISVTFPSTLQTIGGQAFSGCIGLTSVSIPEGVTSLDSSVFYNCSALTEVSLPSTLVSLGNMAFSGCAVLEEITLPASLETIGYMAFYGDKGMKEITCYAEKVPATGFSAFEEIDTSIPVYVPYGTLEAYKADAEWGVFLNMKEMPNSAIESLESNDAPAVYFDINGRIINIPSKGQLVIKKQGNKVSKVIVR